MGKVKLWRKTLSNNTKVRYDTRTELYQALGPQLTKLKIRTMVNERKLREEIVRNAHRLHAAGFVAATDGNLSVRMDSRRILTTPTGMSKADLKPYDLVVVDYDGNTISGRRRPSSELAMHLLIYSMRDDVHAVVHGHPPTATGFAAAGLALNQPLVCEVVIGLGSIPLARYGTPGTPELTDALAPYIPDYDAILMANHGVVAYGEDVQHAYMKMETVEHFAKIVLVTHQLGRQHVLGEPELAKLIEARRKYAGTTSRAAMPLRPAGD